MQKFGRLVCAIAAVLPFFGLAESAVTHRIVATEAEQTGGWADATVAGDDAWAAIQGVIDGCGVGDLILVKAGSYLLTNELAFASAELRGVTLRSDDGEGKLARKTTLLIGGYPATSNRLVRIATPEVIVEGFTLTNGFVNSSCGGGAYLDNCGADAGLRSCDIVGCTAWHEPYVTANARSSTLGTGGGVYVYKTGCISNCLVRANTAFAGGAVYLHGTLEGPKQSALPGPRDVPRVTACELVENQIVGWGDYNEFAGSTLSSVNTTYIDHSSIVSNRCNVTNNGQYTTVGCKGGYLVISNCVFEANHLGKKKGPVVGANTGDRVICVGNTFIREGTTSGVLYNSGVCESCTMIDCQSAIGWNVLRNCFFFANTNKQCVGTGDGAKVTAENCTFVNNKGAIWSNGGGTTATRTNRVVNCLFFDNENDIYAINEGNATPIALFVSNTCIRASSLVKTGNHKFGLLVTNGCNIVYNGGQREYAARGLIRFYANGRGDCHLRAGSALLGAGMTLGWMDGAVDLDGNPRVAGGAPDIGCYERQAGTIDPPLPCTRAVAKEEDKTGEWADATVGLQAAVDAAYEDEPLYVKAGTYNVAEPITLKNQGVLLIGEGPGATIIDGGYPARTNRLFTITQAGTRIQGMTLQNAAFDDNGGAILVSHDDFTLDSCVVSNCCAGFNGKTARYGGCVYIGSVYPNVLVTNTFFTACQSRIGCGVACCTKTTKLSNWATRETVPVVSDCEFVSNAAYPSTTSNSGATGHPQGAGAWGVLWVEHSRFAENALLVTDAYGAVLALDANAVATNCLFEGHTYDDCSILAGRGDCLNSGNCLLSFCTFRNNAARMIIKGSANVENCVIVSNAFTKGNGLSVNGTSLFRNCLFACNTGAAGVGNSTFENCTFATNEYGICLYVWQDAPTFRNCVSCGNTGTVSRIGNTYSGTADFCFERGWSQNGRRTGTFEDNAVLGCRELPIYNGAAGATFDFCSLDKTDATSNIVAVVERRGFKFVDPANGNWRLKQNSPLRDAAFVLDWMTDSAVDLDGKPRRISSDGKSYPDSLPDIGCYECDIPKPGFLLQVW